MFDGVAIRDPREDTVHRRHDELRHVFISVRFGSAYLIFGRSVRRSFGRFEGLGADVYEEAYEFEKHSDALVNEPSLDFSRKNWWDSLVLSYGSDRGTS